MVPHVRNPTGTAKRQNATIADLNVPLKCSAWVAFNDINLWTAGSCYKYKRGKHNFKPDTKISLHTLHDNVILSGKWEAIQQLFDLTLLTVK